jgi:hypothetical protein
LFGEIGRIAFVIFEGVAIRLRVVISLLAILKVHEHSLNLMEDVVLGFQGSSKGVFSVAD